ncbi:hypothetical protein Ait01nite_061780 [Actinoplanes italicus]|uniref:Flavin reductase n=2 Tax=Actinoplanes italicus TaxID=113567 RepID=A0A2T0K592_9ACTN|nr:hypothetical protein CLV67_114257 [Actinoplanes italicus]GIE33133.1 hypothetical protein Ait01nite_061780 [Actinoplanes italicus]
MTESNAEHVCERPSWQCRACGEPWPCPPARTSLAGGADRVMLTMYMWGHLDRAMTELPPGPPAELFDRFLRWTDGRLETAGCAVPLSQSA